MRAVILAASLSGMLIASQADIAHGQSPPPAPTPAAGATTPRPGAPARIDPPARTAPSTAQPGGIYARPGRCRDQAIRMSLRGLARQRFVKRCRIARRALPRPVPSESQPNANAPAPGLAPTIGAPPKSPGQP